MLALGRVTLCLLGALLLMAKIWKTIEQIQGGPLAVLNGVITPINGLING